MYACSDKEACQTKFIFNNIGAIRSANSSVFERVNLRSGVSHGTRSKCGLQIEGK